MREISREQRNKISECVERKSDSQTVSKTLGEIFVDLEVQSQLQQLGDATLKLGATCFAVYCALWHFKADVLDEIFTFAKNQGTEFSGAFIRRLTDEEYILKAIPNQKGFPDYAVIAKVVEVLLKAGVGFAAKGQAEVVTRLLMLAAFAARNSGGRSVEDCLADQEPILRVFDAFNFGGIRGERLAAFKGNIWKQTVVHAQSIWFAAKPSGLPSSGGSTPTPSKST